MTATQEPIRTSAIGRPLDRVDGPAKVTGGARYSAEITLPNTAYLALVGATVAAGRVAAVDASAARAAQGVLAVLTHDDLPKIAARPHLLPSLVGFAAPGESFFPMQDDVVHYAGQPVALVVAQTYEQAQYAATLVHVSYEVGPSLTTIEQGREQVGAQARRHEGALGRPVRLVD